MVGISTTPAPGPLSYLGNNAEADREVWVGDPGEAERVACENPGVRVQVETPHGPATYYRPVRRPPTPGGFAVARRDKGRELGELEADTDSPAGRAAAITQAPVWMLIRGFAFDELFVSGLERVVRGTETPDVLASRYQRRGSRGHRVMLRLIDRAVWGVGSSRYRPLPSIRESVTANLLAIAEVTWHPSPVVPPGGRQRWRWGRWREDAIETLLAKGAGRCRVRGCVETGEPRYCAEHEERDRRPGSTPQADPEGAARVHDAAMRAAGELLDEVGALLGI